MNIDHDFNTAKERAASSLKSRSGIGTQKERILHATLKYFFEPDEAYHEIKIGRFFADINKGDAIVEIQTRNFNLLKNKLTEFLENHSVTIVYPIISTKWLSWVDAATGELSKPRRSPKSETIYYAYDELYKIKMFLNEPNLYFAFVFLDVDERRLLNGWSKDKKKGSHRMDRIPLKINDIVEINCIDDYIKMFPDNLPDQFTVKDFASASHINRRISTLALNILNHIGAVKRVGKSGNAFLYKKCLQRY